MALTGLHVTCCKLGTKTNLDANDPRNGSDSPTLLGSAIWSETLAAAGTTTRGATGMGGDTLRSFLMIRSSVESFVSIAANPNAGQASGDAASGSARFYMKAGEDLAIICNGGDRVAWVPA